MIDNLRDEILIEQQLCYENNFFYNCLIDIEKSNELDIQIKHYLMRFYNTQFDSEFELNHEMYIKCLVESSYESNDIILDFDAIDKSDEFKTQIETHFEEMEMEYDEFFDFERGYDEYYE